MDIDQINIKKIDGVRSFLGTGWAFPPDFNINTGETLVVSDFQDISESLRILFSVTPGERVTHLKYGCDLYAKIFEPIDSTFEFTVKEMITTAINDYEPRVEVLDILTDIKDYADGLVKIEIIYRERATNTRHNIVFPFYKNEGTSLPEEIS